MLERIIRIAATAVGALLLVGCQKQDDLASRLNDISFEAGSLLLKDDAATKTGTIKEGTSFSNNNQIAVFGYHSGKDNWPFEGTAVRYEYNPPTINHWTYSPGKSWDWTLLQTDYYDFIGVYPHNKITGNSKSATTNVTTVDIPYDPTTEQYDLMVAGTRRRISEANPIAPVPLQFRHLLCAVKVKVTNKMDAGAKPFTLTSYHFKNLQYTSGTAHLVINNGTFSTSWQSTTSYTGEKYGESGSWTLTTGGLSHESGYDLLIPQTLNQSSQLVLHCTYKNESDVDVTYNPALSLRDILIKNSSSTITKWDAGKVYVYEIEIRIGGGVIVTVSTTDWEDVDAKTPGLQI